MDDETLRAWWWSRQGLDGSLAGKSCRTALKQSGWCRSIGGATPYLAIFARSGASRKEVDQDVASVEIHELPSARGCTYVLPKEDYGVGLRLAQGRDTSADFVMLKRFFDFSDREKETLIEATLESLQGGPLDPKQIKGGVGDAARSLGEEGKKRGIGTTLPPVLGYLQNQGRIRRVPVDGRLDQQRYRYVIWDEALPGLDLSYEEALTELARKYFSWIGPASIGSFQTIAGVSGNAAKEALAPLGLIQAFPGSDMVAFPEDAEALRSFTSPREPVYSLLGSIDSLRLHRDDVASMVATSDLGRQIPSEKGLMPLGLKDSLECHLIVDRGRLVGLWLYDPGEKQIVWTSFVPKNEALKAAVVRTEAYIRDQLGDCRSFSLDSPESRKKIINLLRKL